MLICDAKCQFLYKKKMVGYEEDHDDDDVHWHDSKIPLNKCTIHTIYKESIKRRNTDE